MEPIPYYYDSINRSAIVVKPLQPFYDWINAIYPDSPVPFTNEATVYLLKVKDSTGEIENWLKRNFDNIFQNELNEMHTDENDWPQKRTYKLFSAWFETSVQATIFDMEETAIIK